MKTKNILLALSLIAFFASCSLKKDLAALQNQLRNSQVDTDDDGVPNMYDRGDSTPSEAKVFGDGTAIDIDMDGIPDYMDEEPFSPKGAKVDEKGKAIDSDNDGVPDAIDKESTTTVGQLVNFQGVAIASSKSNSGNALSMQDGANSGLPTILFKYSFDIEDFAYTDIMVVFNYLSANPDVKIKVIGHTDNIGTDKSNEELGLKRATAVAKVLIALGIQDSRIIIETKGEAEPQIDAAQLTFTKLNRRVEFEIVK